MRTCRGWGVGSALALTVHMVLCGCPLTCTVDPPLSCPAEDWQLVECLYGPEREIMG